MENGMLEYLANLEHRDRREQAQRGIIDQYTKLADRLAQSSSTHSTQPATIAPPGSPATPSINAPGDTASLRASLAAAQQARTALEAQVKSLASLKKDNTAQLQLLQAKERELSSLQRKVRDRNEEIKEGKKLVEQVQDEMVSLNLQLNMAEQKADDLRAENHNLVDRWMKKMGQEADRMNDESKW